MRSSSTRSGLFSIGGFLLAGALLAQAGSQVANWTVPPYRASGAGGGYTTMVDISDAAIFVAVTPCRVVDTRNAVGPYGGPALNAGATRPFDIDSGPCTGIPAGSAAYSLSIGAILPPGNGFLTAWPTGSAEPVVSQLNYLANEVVANAAIVPGGTSGQINLKVNVGPTHVYIDINGYFMDSGGQLNDNTTLRVTGSDSGEPTIYGLNLDFTSASSFVNGVRGYVNTTQNNPSGVFGLQDATTGINYGVTGQGDSGTNGAAGVRGYGGSGTFPGGVFNFDAYPAAGVKALGRDGNGINAFASGFHSAGSFHTVTAAGAVLSHVYIGWNEFGVLGIYAEEGNVLISDNFSVSGTKSFAQPHPTDASKQIRYISVEAPKAEIFFRGSAQIERGLTKIPIPDEFRLVAKAGTYSAMVTPVGAMATVAVMAEDADGVVVQASRNVKINYVIYALREGYENHEPIEPNAYYRPQYEGLYTTHQNDNVMRLMRQNGTIRPDGTVNMETAQKAGWALKPEAENPKKPGTQPAE